MPLRTFFIALLFVFLPQVADSQSSELLDSIHVLQQRVEQLEALLQLQLRQIAFADSCIVRQCNNALNAPYDQRRLRSALSAFDRISSPDYREETMPLRQLLADYGRYHHELLAILKRANDDRDMRNPFVGKETAERYIAEIKQSEYYREVMQQEWVIPYLSSLIQNAIARLRYNDPGEHKYANLKDLLIR